MPSKGLWRMIKTNISDNGIKNCSKKGGKMSIFTTFSRYKLNTYKEKLEK